MAFTLKLIGAGVTLTLTDNVNYAVPYDEWIPGVCQRKRGRLAGSGLYEDVEEQIPLHIRGATGTAALANLMALMDVIEAAEQFDLGGDAGVVTLEYLPNNSNLGSAVQAMVVGGSVSLPTYVNDFANQEIPGVTLTVIRRGLWIGAEEAPAATSAQTHPYVFSATFATNQGRNVQPLAVDFSGFQGSQDSSGDDLGSEAYLVTASNQHKIKLIEAESATIKIPGGTFSTAVDADASGGSIRRLQPTVLGNYELKYTASPAFTVEGQALYAGLVVVRNNSTTISYSVTLSAYVAAAESASMRTSPPVIIDTSTTDPRVVRLNPVLFEGLPDRIKLTFSPSAASASSGDRLDVDVAVVVQMTNPADRVVGLMNINKANLVSPLSLQVAAAATSERLPSVVQAAGGAAEYRISYRGDVYLLATGDRMAACLIGTTGSHWRIVNGQLGSSPTVVSSAMTAARNLAYRVPE